MRHPRVAARAALPALACTDVDETSFEVGPPEISLVPADITATDLGFASAVDVNNPGQVLAPDGVWDPVTRFTLIAGGDLSVGHRTAGTAVPPPPYAGVTSEHEGAIWGLASWGCSWDCC